VKEAIRDEGTKQLIAQHYNDIVIEENSAFKKANRTLALRLAGSRITKKKDFKFEPHTKAPLSESLAFGQSLQEEESKHADHLEAPKRGSEEKRRVLDSLR